MKGNEEGAGQTGRTGEERQGAVAGTSREGRRAAADAAAKMRQKTTRRSWVRKVAMGPALPVTVYTCEMPNCPRRLQTTRRDTLQLHYRRVHGMTKEE